MSFWSDSPIGHLITGQYHTGAWGLPDVGWTERITRKRTEQGGSQLFGQPYVQAAERPPYQPPTIDYEKDVGPTLDTSTGGNGTYTPPAPTTTTPTSGGGTTQPAQPSGPSPEELARQRYEQETRSAIESGYSGYFDKLNAMLNEGLPAQRTAQEGIARSQYTQGVAGLGSQRAEGLGLLGKQRTRATESQARNLRDIAANLRNSFMAGNVYLGARGAGDSSAANQYSYALTKLGTRQRGDIMRQTADIQKEIDDREAKLQNIYTDEVNNLAAERDQKIMGITQWFANAQNQIREAQGRGELEKGQDLASLSQNLLNNAINNLNAVKQESSNRRAALEQWALSNAKNIQEVRANMGAIQGYSPQLPQAPRKIAGQPQVSAGGNINVPGYYGSYQDEEKNKLFNNPAWMA